MTLTGFQRSLICAALSAVLSACAYIQQDSVTVVQHQPADCAFIAYLPHTSADSWEEGINRLRRETIRQQGDTLYLPPDKQTVMAKRVQGRYLSIGSAYRCAGEP